MDVVTLLLDPTMCSHCWEYVGSSTWLEHVVLRRLISFTVNVLACFLNCLQDEQLYTWASVGLPVSSHLWELYGGRPTGREQSLRSCLHQSAKTPGALLAQVSYISSTSRNILQHDCPVFPFVHNIGFDLL